MGCRPNKIAAWFAQAYLPRPKKKSQPAPDVPLTVSQAAERFNLNPRTLYALCKGGSLKHTRIGRSIRIAPAELQKLVTQGPREKTGLLD